MNQQQPVHLPVPMPHGGQHLPTVVQPPGQTPYYAQPPQIIVLPQQDNGAQLTPVTTRLLLGGGIGAGAVVAFAVVGPMLIVTLQTLAITALAIGGSALGIAIAAHMALKTFTNTRTGKKK